MKNWIDVLSSFKEKREPVALVTVTKCYGSTPCVLGSRMIITEDKELAKKFMERVDSAAVYHNASTRFTDGGQMGVGAELAISTDKLHHRGPLGLKQLVTNKYYVFGDGHVRV